jgi:hypothetical protein
MSIEQQRRNIVNGWHLTWFIVAIVTGGTFIFLGAHPGIFSQHYYPGSKKKRYQIIFGTIIILATFAFVTYRFLIRPI